MTRPATALDLTGQVVLVTGAAAASGRGRCRSCTQRAPRS